MTLWGGRFESGPSEVLWEFTTDPSDRRLLGDDIRGSAAHVRMLAETGILTGEERDEILGALEQMSAEAEEGRFTFEASDEDVHTAVERRAVEIAGPVAGKMHTARSRNDQVVLDLRLYLRRATGERIGQIHDLAGLLADIAEEHATTVIPSYTHLQQAQATSLGHHLLAYAWMVLRDADRLADASRRIDVSPLGAGASSGTTLGIDPSLVAGQLGMSGVFENSLDAVGSRDFVAEYVFCASQAMVNLSRLAEEIILWATIEFGWLRLPDAVATGSSALPQKRNPDIAELVRGRAATVVGALTAIMTLQKALPLAYNRDLQEDKRIVFQADDALAGSLGAMVELLGSASFDPPAPAAVTVSLDLAETLVGRGVPFREAHNIVGRLLVGLETSSRRLEDVSFEDLEAVSEVFTADDVGLIDPASSLARRTSPGSGGAESVEEQVAEIRARIEGISE